MTDKNKETVGIHLEMKGDCNRELTRSAIQTRRTKTREAEARLHDHVKRFPCQSWEASNRK